MIKRDYIYKIKRIEDNKFLYSIENEFSEQEGWQPITKFTSKLRNAKVLRTKTELVRVLNLIIKGEKFISNDKTEYAILGRYEILKFYLSESSDLNKEAKRGEYLYKVKNTKNQKFFCEIYISKDSSKIKYHSFAGSLFLQYKITYNKLGYHLIKNIKGYADVVIDKKIVSKYRNLFEIVCYQPILIYNKTLLIEKKHKSLFKLIP